jgi:hypothetical protein
MTVEILQISIVVAANFHNPSILHPSFLKAENIVPSDWNVEGDVVSTPVSSTVKYDNGIAFLVEPGKLQVSESLPRAVTSLDLEKSVVPELVAKYVRVLPKVPYTAVGINPQGFVATSAPTEVLIQKFINRDSLTALPASPRGLDVRFAYDVHGARLRFGLSAGSVKFVEGPSREGIIVSGNYHQDAKTSDEVLAALSRFRELGADFLSTSRGILR